MADLQKFLEHNHQKKKKLIQICGRGQKPNSLQVSKYRCRQVIEAIGFFRYCAKVKCSVDCMDQGGSPKIPRTSSPKKKKIAFSSYCALVCVIDCYEQIFENSRNTVIKKNCLLHVLRTGIGWQMAQTNANLQNSLNKTTQKKLRKNSVCKNLTKFFENTYLQIAEKTSTVVTNEGKQRMNLIPTSTHFLLYSTPPYLKPKSISKITNIDILIYQ